jgi:hypothetical protein
MRKLRKEIRYLRRIADTQITILWPYGITGRSVDETPVIGPMTFEQLHLCVKYGGTVNPPLDQPISGPVILRVRLKE